jgi:oligopeptide/dipeptide ABC transporter ATP-binding protein
MNQPLLQIENLQVVFRTPFGLSHALRGVSVEIQAGQIFGIVGESGCGKSMTARAILGIVPHPGKVVKGRILFEGQNLREFSEREMQKIRGRRIAMIFQNPKQALNPVFTIGQQLLDVMKHHQIAANKKALYEHVLQLLGDVGLPQTDRILNAYPHRLSGGQQQRVMIAMALSTEPDLLIADEPTTALDVTIQAQILDLLVKLQQERGVTIMLITHDMGVVAKICQHVAVLYAGRVVEQGPVREIFKKTKHPYTQGLLTTLPHPGSRGHDLNVIAGSVPSGFTPITGCAFASRCQHLMDVCQQQFPPWYEFENNHQAACFLYHEKVKEAA